MTSLFSVHQFFADGLSECVREAVPAEEAVKAAQHYCSSVGDTTSGRVDGPDDREWQRAAVLEMTKRARLALSSPVSRAGVLALCKHDDGDCHKDDPCDNCPVYRQSSSRSAGESRE